MTSRHCQFSSWRSRSQQKRKHKEWYS